MKKKSYLLLCIWFFAACTNPTLKIEPLHPVKAYLERLLDSAQVFLNYNDHATALLYHRKVLALSRKHGFHTYEAKALLGMGNLMKHENTDSSLYYLQKALAIADSIGHNQLRADIQYSIWDTQRQRKKYEEAMSALQVHHHILDNLLAQQREKALEELKSLEHARRKAAIAKAAGIGVLVIILLLIWYSRKVRKLNLRLIGAVKLRDRLLSIVSHDLRAPMASLTQVLQLLSKEKLTPKIQQSMLQKAAIQGEAISQGFENLLAWANTQVKGKYGHPTRFSPITRIQSTLSLLDGLAKQKAIQLEVVIDESITVTADPDQFDFMTRNLISNAIKFSFPGGVIRIAGHQQGQLTQISFADQGTGIPPERQVHFWEETIVSHQGTLGEKGTGLGLLLVKEFAESNGGSIHMESGLEEKGTIFTITLPS
ncbi:Signal transduction histidine kinase [bacterium A37T11]|nr:Signal transduction histidine kinase [bacterium A37T11]